MSFVIARPIGGLGNQMFAYAAAYALAQKRGAALVIDKGNFAGYRTWPYHLDALDVPQDMASPAPPGPPVPGRLRRYLRRPRPGITVYREPHFHYDAGFERLEAPVELNGYFQSWRYFEGHEAGLRERFRPRARLAGEAEAMRARIAAAPCAVSLHVRRGDYLSAGTSEVHGVLGPDYYRRAVALVRARHPQAEFFLFSDDPEWVAQHLAEADSTIVRGDAARPWEDLWLMAECDHHVIANSSFSWWGAWLNPREEKMVIAPRAWFAPGMLRANNICDLHPPGWVLL